MLETVDDSAELGLALVGGEMLQAGQGRKRDVE